MIEFLQQWGFLLIPLATVGVTQLLKFFIYSGRRGGVDINALLSYGGMPSGHTAFFTSLSTIIGLVEGFHTAVFAIASMMTIIIIRDALGLRQALSAHGKVINILAKKAKVGSEVEKVKEVLGHTPTEAIIGALVGISFALICYWVIY